MKNLFETPVYEEVIERLNRLTPDCKGHWGKMDVAQMLAHTKEAFKVPLTDKKIPSMLMGRLLGWLMKSKMYNDSAWSRSLPTAPSFKITDSRIFDSEKKQLVELITKFHQWGPDKVGNFPHPFFGKFTKQQWGQSMYKHLNHHLTQFGV